MKIILSILILLSSVSFSKSLNVTKTDDRINHHLFSGEWEKSDSLIELQLSRTPKSVKYNFMKAYNLFYARYFSNTAYDRQATLSKVKHYTWEAIKLGEAADESLENNFYIGCAYAYLARANAMEQEYWNAYWNGSEGENYLEAVIDENPGIHDAYMNLGVFEYYPSFAITGFTSVLAWFGGMSGDREKGLEYIYNVAKDGNLFKDEAALALGIINNFAENNVKEAHHYWTYLLEKYPSNPMAIGNESRTRFQLLIDEKGADFLTTEFDSLGSKYNITNAGALNNVGYSLMNQGRLDDALVVFQTNIKMFPHIANGYDSIAECYMNRNENDMAIKFYKKAYEMMPIDTTVNDDFRQRVMEGIEERLTELGSDINA
jgi:tetratricopeptide (TPR) repeat protein